MPENDLQNNQLLKDTISVLIGAVLLLLPVMWNGYPFIFADTVDYIAGFPLLYRLPIYHYIVNWGVITGIIWLPVIIQALITSHIILLVCRLNGLSNRAFLIIILLLGLFSSLAYFVGFLMPDIFAPILFLCGYLLLVGAGRFSRSLMLYLNLLFIYAALVHITHIYLGIGLWGLLFIAQIVLGKFYFGNLRVLGSCLLALFGVLLLNKSYFNIWSLSPSGNVFLSAIMIEDGTAQKFYQNNCPQKHYKLCDYLNELPMDKGFFLWNDRSPLKKIGGFEGFGQEAGLVVKDTIKNNKNAVIANAYGRVIAALSAHRPAAELTRTTQVYKDFYTIELFFGKDDLQKYANSHELQNTLPYDYLKRVDDIIFPLSVALTFVFCIIYYGKKDYDFVLLGIGGIGFYTANLLLCAVFSGVYDRYQARLSWLFVMIGIIGIMKLFPNVSKVAVQKG